MKNLKMRESEFENVFVVIIDGEEHLLYMGEDTTDISEVCVL